ncbi:DNA-3-methyladenine glycosylase [Ruminococcus sp. Marseille-P6503]|uniref:DNA-3-methyladenine glycosylase family protein n=1 Tax=Ruminococcus sp. Marseille-P6503 TaxID=2364796 RepID=UPI000F53C45F|nr:DNA-3-methyladenine glycosylase [Ruminococcus sp. Marseille-P6503]
MYFQYDESAIEYLKQKDKRLAKVINKVGKIEREVDNDLFSSVVHHIIGQQISTKAQATIWQRMQDDFSAVNADTILAAGIDRLQSLGMTFKKAEYITDFAVKVKIGAFDLQGIWNKSDDEAITELTGLKGIGVWTAEMILLFCMQRPNVFSYGDLAILRGMRMVYHHRKIDRKLFDKYRRRLSPYCSVASLYFWAVAGGAIPEMKDYAPKKENKKSGQKGKAASNSKSGQVL